MEEIAGVNNTYMLIGIAFLSIVGWGLCAKVLAKIIVKLKERKRVYKKLEEKRYVNKYLDDKYNRLYRDTVGKEKVKLDLLELLLFSMMILNVLALITLEVNIIALVLGVVVGVIVYITSDRTIKDLSDKEEVLLKVLRLRIRFNKYREDLSTNDKNILEKDFEDMIKSFKRESKNKDESDEGKKFVNTLKKLESLGVKVDRFLHLETL